MLRTTGIAGNAMVRLSLDSVARLRRPLTGWSGVTGTVGMYRGAM